MGFFYDMDSEMGGIPKSMNRIRLMLTLEGGFLR